jgi:hypothetical protein
VVVVPDRGGQREDALYEAGDDAGWRAATVLFEVELPLEALVDRLDDLPQRLEQFSSESLRLTLAGRPQQPEVQLGQLVLEVSAEVVLVADQRLSGPGGDQLRFGNEQVQQRLTLISLGPGQGELTVSSGSKGHLRLKMSVFAQVKSQWITRWRARHQLCKGRCE